MSALDNLSPKCTYDGVQFFLQSGSSGIKTSPRFGSQAQVVERVAPFSFPANIVRQVINTGMLNDFTLRIAIKGSSLITLRTKVETGMKSLTIAGDAAQQAILTTVGPVDASVALGYIYVTCTFRGRA